MTVTASRLAHLLIVDSLYASLVLARGSARGKRSG